MRKRLAREIELLVEEKIPTDAAFIPERQLNGGKPIADAASSGNELYRCHKRGEHNVPAWHDERFCQIREIMEAGWPLLYRWDLGLRWRLLYR